MSQGEDNGVVEGRTPRWFLCGLAGVCLGGGALRLLLLSDYLANNPMSAAPTVDALTYWEWAGRIAAGRLSDGTPFFSAPLYPYLLGLLRAMGGGLTAAYVAQIVIDLVTAGLLAWIARLRFGPGVGLAAAAILLLMLEPASYSLRVLGGSLQLLVVTLAWGLLAASDRRPSLLRAAATGGCLALLALTYAPAVVCLPVVALWFWGRGGWRGRAFGRALATLVAGALVISPATIHNYRACGEFIPISAQAGVTFAQGNAPGADGTYARRAGVSIYHRAQNIDALRVYTDATGRDPSWNAANRCFFSQGLRFWREQPRRAGVLLARKAYWFLTGRNYGDIIRPTLEIALGLTPRLRLAPIHTAWLIPLALAAICAWSFRPGRRLPELLLFGVPLLVVIAFWYSPRYRLPAIPVIVVGCAWALSRAWSARERWRWRAIVAGAVVVGVGLGVLNRAVGFDPRDAARPQFHNALGSALAHNGRLAEAAEQFRLALASDPGYAEASSNLGNTLALLGDSAAALAHARRAVEANPDDAAARGALGLALAMSGRVDEALTHFRKAVALNPRDPRLRNNLGNALRVGGDLDVAAAEYRIAIDLDPMFVDGYVNLAGVLASVGEFERAAATLGRAISLAEEAGRSDKAEEFRARLRSYEHRRPFVPEHERP